MHIQGKIVLPSTIPTFTSKRTKQHNITIMHIFCFAGDRLVLESSYSKSPYLNKVLKLWAYSQHTRILAWEVKFG